MQITEIAGSDMPDADLESRRVNGTEQLRS